MHLFLNGITGHRGNPQQFLQNSIPSFQSAVKLGVDFVELDIRFTSDRQLVVIHNDSTGEIAEQDLKVAETTLADLKALKLKLPPQSPECHLSTLREILQALGPDCPAGISIQPKTPGEEGIRAIDAALEIARDLNMLHVIAFNDGQLPLMRHVKEANPSIPVFYDTSDGSDQEIQDALTYGFETVVNYHETITREWVQKILDANLIPGVWNISTLDEYRFFKNLGVKRFYADNPGEILQNL